MAKKNLKKRALRTGDETEEGNTSEDGDKCENEDDLKESEQELDFWLTGHITGEKREREQETLDPKEDPVAAINALQGRMGELESQMNSLLKNIKEGFETMEASQEVAFRAFYN